MLSTPTDQWSCSPAAWSDNVNKVIPLLTQITDLIYLSEEIFSVGKKSPR